MRRLRAAETELEENDRRLERATAGLAGLALAQEETAAAVQALESSPQMRDKKALDDAIRLADERRRGAERAQRELAAAGEIRRVRQREEQTATEGAAEAWNRAEAERRQDEVWKRLTRRTHGTGSGGEKARSP